MVALKTAAHAQVFASGSAIHCYDSQSFRPCLVVDGGRGALGAAFWWSAASAVVEPT